MGFRIGNFNFSPPKISLPKFSPPKISLPKVNLPKPQQVFGNVFGGKSQPAKQQVRTSAPKPNLIQRGLNFGKSFVQNPVKATQRLQQKVTNKVVNTGNYIKNGTVSNFKKTTNFAGTQFKRFENWADKGIKNNHQWAQQNRNSKNLLNKATANLNLGFTKAAKFGNDSINTAADYYRGLRKSDNLLVKGAGYLGGGLTSLGRGLASPVTFADPRLSGKQRTGQVIDGALSYIPVGKIAGIGGKILKPVTGQIAKRAPWLVNGGTKLIGKGQNVVKQLAKTKPGQIINQVVNRGKQFTTKIGNGLNRNVTPKALRGTENKVRNTLAKVNNLPNQIANRGKNTSVNHVTKQVVNGSKQKTWKDFQGANLDETLKNAGIKRSITNDLGLQGNKNLSRSIQPPQIKGDFVPSQLYNKASEIGAITKGTKQWDQAVSAIRNGGLDNINNVRVKNASEAKQLLKEAFGDNVKFQPTYATPTKGTYQIHPSEINKAQGINNDLSHFKFTDKSGR
ncbi:MAG: hypothetical protein MUC29_06005, partial [Pyrinomonadaceae bacterium]|nr:hypothetical protein [Pyrinomonadaceae bacterium]